MTSEPSLSPKYIDGEVLRVVQKMENATIEAICWELHYLPKVLIASSIKRLMNESALALIVNDRGDIRPGTNPDAPTIRPGRTQTDDQPHSSTDELRIKPCQSAGTSSSNKKYLWLYKGNKAIAYIGGGHEKSAIAIRRKTEIENLISRGVISPEQSDEEIKRLVQGVKLRNKR